MPEGEEIEFTVAPTEPPLLKTIATTISMFPEYRGCDVTWFAHDEVWGVQRKELKDFIQSVGDGRLARELAQMQGMPMPMILIEGRVSYDLNGNLLLSGYGQQFTRAQFLGMLWSVRNEGVHVDFTESTQATTDYIRMLGRWSAKTKHTSIMRRPGPVSAWGKPDHTQFAVHILQGFDGIGLDKARAIVNHFGGLPLTLTCTDAELLAIPGIGKGLVGKLREGTQP